MCRLEQNDNVRLYSIRIYYTFLLCTRLHAMQMNLSSNFLEEINQKASMSVAIHKTKKLQVFIIQ